MRPRTVRWWMLVFPVLLVTLVLPLPALAAAATPPDYAFPNGHFYTQANGTAAPSLRGYPVYDGNGVNMWSEFQRLGGVAVVGYPVSNRFKMDGFTVQAFQKFILQWHPETGQVAVVNVFDKMHDAGKDAYLLNVRQTPPPADTSADTGKTWPQVMAAHQALLNSNAAIKAAYFADKDPINHYGLPMTPPADEGNVIVVRAQRAVFQQWKQDVPWAKAGQVTVANGGDIAKEVGLIPLDPALPIYPDPSWVGAKPINFTAADIEVAHSDLPDYGPASSAAGSPPPTYQQVMKDADAMLGPLDAHGLVDIDAVDLVKLDHSAELIGQVEVYQSTDGARWSFGDWVRLRPSGATQVSVPKLGDDTMAFTMNLTTGSGVNITNYTVVFRSANVVDVVMLGERAGQGSINDAVKLAQISLDHITLIQFGIVPAAMTVCATPPLEAERSCRAQTQRD